jgi:ABC-type bacteriocin/lantibiotic exporter with double-glycine peptidase domain
VSGWSQAWISLLAVAIFVLNTAPLEMQRRILNAAAVHGELRLVVGLALAYAAIVLSEGLTKLLMNIYRGWVGEKAVRALRLAASLLVDAMPAERTTAGVQGVEISLILAEPDPIGSFVGVAVSELVLQVGILLSVFGYMFYTQRTLALICLAIFSPQLVFVPLMQRAINRRVSSRIAVLRLASVGALRSGSRELQKTLQQELRFAEIFQLNLGIFKIKYSMNFLMNLTHNFGKVLVLGVGGWFVINGQAEVGTLVAFISGLNNVADPWGDLVNWFQEMMVTDAKYRIYVAAMHKLARGEEPVAGV